MSELVGSPEDRFSRVAAQLLLLLLRNNSPVCWGFAHSQKTFSAVVHNTGGFRFKTIRILYGVLF